MKKRIFSLLLVLCLALGLVGTALAAGGGDVPDGTEPGESVSAGEETGGGKVPAGETGGETEESAAVVIDGEAASVLNAPAPRTGHVYSETLTRGDEGSIFALKVGDTLTLSRYEGGVTCQGWETDSNNINIVSGDGRSVTIEALSPGMATITVRVDFGTTRDFNILVLDDQVPVYVYVAGEKWKNNDEFQELIGLTVSDTNDYFPAGEITLDASFLSGKRLTDGNNQLALINEGDWSDLSDALSEIDTNVMIDDDRNFSDNNGNKVGEYLEQAIQDIGSGPNEQKTALFYWKESDRSYGFEDQTVRFHLDLRFNTNTITFITGNNGITSGAAQDGAIIDYRTYITGSLIQPPRNLDIPEGYQQVAEYYADPDFQHPWNGIGTALNKDDTVYIKITPLENAVINYYVGAGVGTVSPDAEAFNPETGEPAGSTATTAEGYIFDGWYDNEKCTGEPVSKSATFVPTAPNGGWQEATTYDYYAKFVLSERTLTIEKTVTGGMGSHSDDFTFTLTLSRAGADSSTEYYTEHLNVDAAGTVDDYDTGLDVGEDRQTYTFTLSHGEKIAVKVPYGYTASVTENAPAGYTVTASVDDGEPQNDKSVEALMTDNHTIVYTNNRQPVPPTGLTDNHIPFIIMTAAAAVGAAALICGIAVRRRRRRQE